MMILILPFSDIQITVVSHKMPLFGLQIRSAPQLAHRHICFLIRPRHGILRAFCRHHCSRLHALRMSCAFVVTHKFVANFTDLTLFITKLAMLSSMHIYPPCICNHRRKTLVVAHLSTLPLCPSLLPHLACSEQTDTLERCLSNIRQNRVFQVFPSWI